MLNLSFHSLKKGYKMQILEVLCFDKRHKWQGSIEVVGLQKANELIAFILSDESSLVAYCTIEVKAVCDKSAKG